MIFYLPVLKYSGTSIEAPLYFFMVHFKGCQITAPVFFAQQYYHPAPI